MFNDIAEREQRIVNEHAEREYRLLSDTAERDRRARELEAQREQRLLDDARHARELEAQREQCARQELLADVQLQREREAQREIDMRRDLYDLSRQSSRAAALEAELKCLKVNIGPPTVAYEVPVQLDDIAPPEVNTAVQMSPLRPATPVTPIDNFAVQGLPHDVTHRRPPISTVHRPDIAHALTSNIHAVNPQSADNCYGADISTSRPLYSADSMSTSPPPFFSSAMSDQLSVCRTVVTSARTRTPISFPRELPQLTDPGYMRRQYDTPPHSQLHTLSRRPVIAVSDSLHAFPRSPPQLVCTQSTMTSMLPWQPAYTHDGPPPSEDVLTSALPRPSSLVGPPSREDVVTSALPRPPTAPADFVYDTVQRPTDCIHDSSNVYTHSDEQWLPQLALASATACT